MVLAVISTDIKKSSFLWNKNAKDMFNKLQLHHAILRVNFNYYKFGICPSSPEGDAFIASRTLLYRGRSSERSKKLYSGYYKCIYLVSKERQA